MDELWVEERKMFYIVEINTVEYKISKKKAVETSNNWRNISPEQVAQMWAIIKAAEENEKCRKMSWKTFDEGYYRIMQLMNAEQLISYMTANFGCRLLKPDNLYEEIKNDLF